MFSEKEASNKISLSVFIPFFNEEKNIQQTIEETVNALGKIPRISKHEILIINDGSIDSTNTIALKLTGVYEKVRLITHKKNMGYGKALISGIKNSQYEYVFFMDGDLQFDIREIHRLLQMVPKYSAVIGYRKKREDSLCRTINAHLWNILNKLVFKLNVKDINCAFKLFKREIVTNLNLVSNGAMISSEILLRLKLQGVDFVEIPITHRPRQHGKQTGANPKVIFVALKEFMTLLQTDLGKNTRKKLLNFILFGFLLSIIGLFVYSKL